MPDKRNENAKFQIKNGQLVITLGLGGLKRSIETDTDLAVIDDVSAAFSIKHVISAEEENGRTPFHKMLASAAYQAYSDGEDGFEELED